MSCTWTADCRVDGVGDLSKTEVSQVCVCVGIQATVGLLKLMDVACQIPEQCAYPVSLETRQHVSLCLSRLWDDMVFDENRDQYKAVCNDYMT
jgi:hypothetical protein